MAYGVMGVSGCGKSLVGAAIAKRFGVEFVEGDALHPQANIAKMSQGIALDDVDRFPWLERIGATIRASLDREKGMVISCSALKKVYRDRLRDFAGGRLTFVFLDGSEAILAARLTARNGHFMPASLLKSQLATLERPIGEDRVITIDIAGSQADVIENALEELGNCAR